MYAQEIRLAAEAAPRAALPDVTKALWQAFATGQITEAEAESLSALVEARQQSHRSDERCLSLAVADTAQDRQRSARTGVGSRPRTNTSMERRRRWAASGRLPPALAARFSLAEHAVLACVAAETARRGDCRLAIGHIASIVGVSETTVRNAIGEARRLGLLTVEERRVADFRNLPNVVRIVSREWVAWLRLARKEQGLNSQPQLSLRGGGCKSAKGTPTQIFKPGKTGIARPPRERIATSGAAS